MQLTNQQKFIKNFLEIIHENKANKDSMEAADTLVITVLKHWRDMFGHIANNYIFAEALIEDYFFPLN